MKRVIPLTLAAAALVGCQDLGVQPPADGLSAIIVDGAHGGNGRFFFLPPLVENPSNTLFGEFDPDALPTIEVCRLEEQATPGEYACGPVVKRVTPGEIDGAADHYHYGLDVAEITTPNPNDLELFRIDVMIGSTAPGFQVLRLLGSRDFEVGESMCGGAADDVLCVGDGTALQIKFRIDVGHLCFGLGNCAGGLVTDQQTAFTTNNGTAGVQAEAQEGDQFALLFEEVPFGECDMGDLGINQEIGLDDGTFRSNNWAQFPTCFHTLTTEGDNIENVLEGLVGYEICFSHFGLMIDEDAQKPLARIARMSDDRSELQILAQQTGLGLAQCIEAQHASEGIGAGVLNVARRFVNTVTAPFVPEPLFAAKSMRRFEDFGVGGLGPKSVIGVVLPATVGANVADFGVVADGASLAVQAFATDDDGGAVSRNEVTFTPEAGDTFDGGGAATYETAAPGGSTGGTWVVNGPGTHTLTATCFPCGGAGAPVTGDDGSDGIPEYDNLSAANEQVVEYTATILDLSINIVGDPRPAVGETFDVQICIGADFTGATVLLEGRANNGDPTELVPSQVTSPAVFDPVGSGCWVVPVYLTKSGGIRIVATLLDGDGNPVEVEESVKVNIKPK